MHLGTRRELGNALALNEDPLVATLLHSHALGRDTPYHLGDGGGVVQVVLRESLLDGLRGAQPKG